jgi:hypothetical protein
MSARKRVTRESWKPDDSAIEGSPGARKIKNVLERHGIIIVGGKQVVTSRDKGMDDIRFELMREGMPPGFVQWQLPIVFGAGTFAFLTVSEPGAVVPTHKHKRDLFRIVLSGSIITDGIELKTADWMYVPKGVPYSYHAAFTGSAGGAITFHVYD